MEYVDCGCCSFTFNQGLINEEINPQQKKRCFYFYFWQIFWMNKVFKHREISDQIHCWKFTPTIIKFADNVRIVCVTISNHLSFLKNLNKLTDF